MTVPARWLTAEEQRTWRLFLTACQSLFGAIDAQLLRDSGLPHGYYEILVHLSEAPARALRMNELAKASTYSKSRLSHAVARLEERGWVARRECPTDRRGQVAQLTDEGFAVLAEAAHGHVEQVRRSLVDALTPEQVRQLAAISTAVIAASKDGGAECPDAGAECPDAGPACPDAGMDCDGSDAELHTATPA